MTFLFCYIVFDFLNCLWWVWQCWKRAMLVQWPAFQNLVTTLPIMQFIDNWWQHYISDYMPLPLEPQQALYTLFFTCTVALPNTYQYSGAFKDNKDIKKLTGVWHFSCCVQSQKTNSMCVSRCPPLSTPLGFPSTCQSLKYYQTLQNQEEMAHLSGNVWRSRVIHTWRSGEYLGQRDSVGLSHS